MSPKVGHFPNPLSTYLRKLAPSVYKLGEQVAHWKKQL